jgi:hypothetical protein
MVNAFHLHNSGNSVDICEFLFPFNPIFHLLNSINVIAFNTLSSFQAHKLWHSGCSKRTSSTVPTRT